MPRLTHKEIEGWVIPFVERYTGDTWTDDYGAGFTKTSLTELLWEFQAHLQERGIVTPDVKKAQKGRRS